MSQMELGFGYDYVDVDTEECGTWVMPTSLPDLTSYDVIALDTETHDPNLMERGAGWDIGDGNIIGVSVAVSRDDCWYIPLKRQMCRDGFDVADVAAWVTASFTKGTTMVGANLIYDLGWLQTIGCEPECSLFDVQFAEALLDEHRAGYSLDSLAEQYGLGGKVSNDLYEWCAATFGGVANGKQRANIYRSPLRLVGPYAEADAYLPLEIREQQLPQIAMQNLERVIDLEHRLVPMLIAMRKRGVRVDMKARDKLSKYIDERLSKAENTVRVTAGREVNTNASSDIAAVFDANGWEYPLLPPTPKQTARAEITGVPVPPKPSFKKDWLLAQDNKFANAVADVRRLGKLKNTFVDGYFKLAHKGRIHCTLHPLRTGENGTVSGRLACLPDYVMITMEHGTKPFRDVKAGDRVLTHKGNIREVLDKWYVGTKIVWHTTFSNGMTLDCTPDHKILTQLGWRTWVDICASGTDDIWVITYDGKNTAGATVVSTDIVGVVKVYDMEIEADHSFIANGVFVHNCSKPNLQNIPARDPEFGPLIRGLFIPDEGETWVSHDYSQIELRFLAHYAVGTGAAETRQLFNDDPDVDFHEVVMKKTGLPRKPAKTVSFSLCYGSGTQNTADLLDCTFDEAKAFREAHFSGMPFMKATFDECVNVATSRGHLFTIMGRRARFPEWEASYFQVPEEFRDECKELGTFRDRQECDEMISKVLDLDCVVRGLSQRSRTYKALNSLLQGSAADLMKQAMVDIWESGVCDVLGAPLTSVHDELNWSCPDTDEGRAAVSRAADIMANALTLRVPVKVSHEYGTNWGSLVESGE